MSKLTYAVDVDEMCSIEGLLHAYFFDKKNVVLGANKLQLETMMLVGVAKENIIGQTFEGIFGSIDKKTVEIVNRENASVIQDERTKQFYNIWIVQEFHKLELLTIKIPIYDNNGKMLGVFGISQYMNKFSVPKAFNLGLTKREIECLFHLIEGRSIKQIAINLNISVRTVEGYFENLKMKLNCSSKAELILRALQSEVSLENSLLKSGTITSKALCNSPVHASDFYSQSF